MFVLHLILNIWTYNIPFKKSWKGFSNKTYSDIWCRFISFGSSVSLSIRHRRMQTIRKNQLEPPQPDPWNLIYNHNNLSYTDSLVGHMTSQAPWLYSQHHGTVKPWIHTQSMLVDRSSSTTPTTLEFSKIKRYTNFSL